MKITIRIVAVLVVAVLFTNCAPSIYVASEKLPANHNINSSKAQIEDKLGIFTIALQSTMAGESNLHVAQFIDEQHGWLVSDTKLWQTVNGGDSWELIYSALNSNEERGRIKQVKFKDFRSGWMLKANDVYETRDSGHSWVSLTTPYGRGKGVVWDIQFSEDKTLGWIIGGIYRSISRAELLAQNYPNNAVTTLAGNNYAVLQGAIFQTSDGGGNWTQQLLTDKVYRFTKLHVIDKTHQVAIGDTEVFYTEDSGRGWKLAYISDKCSLINVALEGRPIDIYFTSPHIGWISYSGGGVAKTSDGGKTWCGYSVLKEEISNTPKYNDFFRELYFINKEKGYALNANGSLEETYDSGQTWKEVDSKINFSSMYFIRDGKGLLINKNEIYQFHF